ncbi:MAG: hypothetical protein D6772_00165 [Bacteroidetes bacterium]|nr:MAG: hypothetical protein D6772_00165 [Bacteroidota bacterium]
MRAQICLLACTITTLLTACGGKEPEVRLRLTPAERNKIDTIYQERIGVLRLRWDSLCEARFDSIVVHARDSIVQERLEEEAALRRRQRQNESH